MGNLMNKKLSIEFLGNPGSGKSYTLGVDGSNLLKRITFDA